ncbi:phospholipid carrier-dependent glycosyltransferase [Dysgonomonas sp. ZJ279]|uniref:phospholipid carrier-dependent glycosyltransferase n=1 Tax=Dysgonomonas sp. ZJ279 TaxID=2709796 RepID=UPI0013EC1AE8|nr:phospholipid carrier-dependent glycosyltransferase [Dysgonomonas sp. ZJ279]
MKNIDRIRLWAIDNPVKTIVIIAACIRILVTILYQHITIYPDSEDYIALANRLLNFDLNGYGGERSPGYPLLLSLAHNSFVITSIFQSVIGIITLVLTYKTLLLAGIKKEFSLTITLLVACYLPILFFEFAILSETLTLFVITITFYLFFKIILEKRSRVNDYALLGLSCGYLVLIKPFYIFIPVLIVIFLLCSNLLIQRKFAAYISILILPAFIFLGWSYINKVNTGYFTSTTFYGFNLAQNCVSFAEYTSDEYAEIGHIYARYRGINTAMDKDIAMSIWEAYPELKEETGLSFPDLSKKLYDYSLTTISMNPIGYVKQIGISWLDFWKTSLYYEYDHIKVSSTAPMIKYVSLAERLIFQVIKILFVMLIPYNISRYFRRKDLTPQFTISVVVLTASLLQALITYGTNSRFSFPFELLILISVVLNIKQYRMYLKEKS